MKSPAFQPRSLPRAAALVISALALTLALALASGSGEPRLDGLQRAATIRQSQGYWLLGADGGLFNFGDAGSFGPHRNRSSDIAGMARTRDGGGLWVVDDDGDVFHYGNAINYGSRLLDTDDIAGFVARPQGDGYWMASRGGSVWAFGAAGHQGPAVPLSLNRPIVDMAVTPSGQGYWLVASDGGVFSYGDARFYGSTGAIVLNRPIVGMASTPSGRGYWLVASDGGIFAFGDAGFFGSTGSLVLNRPVVAMASTGTGKGYWLVATDGGVFSFGDAGFHGSTGGITLNQPIMAMVATPLRTISVLPSAAADAALVEEDSSVAVDVLANDSGLDDGGITVSVIDGPDHGSAAVGNDGRITYSPKANYAGADVIVYQVRDVDGDLAAAALTITVSERNDAPVAPPNRSRSTDEDLPLSGLVGASDVDGDQLRYDVTGAAAHGTAVVNSSGSFTYTPAQDYNGPDSFTITVSDGRGAMASAVTDVTVNAVNDTPTSDVLLDATTDEDTAKVIDFTVDDVDSPLGSLVVTGTSSDPAVLAGGGIAMGGADGSRTVTLMPVAEASGTTTVTITVGDGSATTTREFLLTVNAVNDLPAAVADAAGTDEEVAVGIDVLANDTGLGDGGAIVAVVGSTLDSATEGTAEVTGGTITFTPALDVCWTVTFDYTVSDTDGEPSTGTVTVTVNPVNDPPVILPAIDDFSVSVDAPIDPINFSVSDADPADELQVSVHTDGNPTLLTDANLTLVGTGNDWALTIVPTPLEVGTATITISVSDGTTPTEETFTLTVDPLAAP